MQYYLTTAASPANEGTITVSPTSSSGWYAMGTQVTMSAKANPGYVFTGFSGAQTVPAGQGTSVVLTMNGPIAETAQFSPDFTLVISPSYQTVPVSRQSVPYTITVASPGGYTGSVGLMLTSVSTQCLQIPYFPGSADVGGAPATFGINVNCDTNPTATVTVGGVLAGTWHWVTATISISPAADFSITASAPSPSSVAAPGSVSFAIKVNPVNNFTGTVALSASGMPTGTSGASVGVFSPASLTFTGSSVAQTSTLTITTAAGSPAGTYALTIVGVSGSTGHYALASLVVSGTPQATNLGQMGVLSTLVSRHEALVGPNAPSAGGGLYGLPANDAATVNAAVDASAQQLSQLDAQSQTFTDGTAYMNGKNAVLQSLNQQLHTQVSAASAQVMDGYINNFIAPRLAWVALNKTNDTAQASSSCPASTNTQVEYDCLGIWNEITSIVMDRATKVWAGT
jgi:hypothetical protein